MGFDAPDYPPGDEYHLIDRVYGVALPQAYRLPLPQEQPRNASSGGLTNFLVVCAGACRLFGITGYSNKGSAQFIQLFDLAALPADNAIPTLPIAVGAGAGASSGNFGLYFGTAGRWFDRGVVLCNSSTLATKTIGSADTWFDAQYTPQVITTTDEE
jgi:hypothetical protein